MKRILLFAAVLSVVVVGGFMVARQTLLARADQPAGNVNGQPNGSSSLPISQVVLFNSGVGFFQREGQVDGDAHVDLSFQVNDINDLLKSLILQDANGGKVGTVSYDSYDPVDKTLRSFALDLTSNPTVGQILNQARGERAEVVRQQSGSEPLTLSGTIVGVEIHDQPGKDQPVSEEQLNLLTSEGLRGIPLHHVQRVRFLSPTLDSEFRRALEVLARSHDVQKKSVRLNFVGNGKRTVRVGYVVERPIWKTSYRLSLDEKTNLHLQGWALVENTSDDDWNSVRMVLVTGRPITFRMNLYQPLYVPRPWVEPELFASLRPPVYAGDMPEATTPVAEKLEPLPLPPGKGFGKGGFGGKGKGKAGSPKKKVDAPTEGPRLEDNEKRLKEAGARGAVPRDEADKMGRQITGMDFKQGIASIATAQDVGDSYRYLIDQKITLPRQKSSMVPIVNKGVEGSKVSIYSTAVHAKFPLLGLRLKNTTGHPLMQGPITVYEEGAYAGDTRILDLQPDEERLVSYAIDLGTEVVPTSKVKPGPEMTFRIGGNNLTAHLKLRETKTYTIKNRSTQDRNVLIEHPIRSDWKLVTRDKKEKVEKSRDAYRFPVKVSTGKTVAFSVNEEQDRVDVLSLIAGDKDIPPRYALAYGIEVRQVTRTSPEELLSIKIAKGIVHAEYRQRESKSYLIQNNSGEERTFTVDHVIRPDWQLNGPDGKVEKGPGVHREVVTVGEGKTATVSVAEEHTEPFKDKRLGSLDEAKLREFLQSKATPAPVRAAVEKTLAYQAELGRLGQQLKGLQGQHKELSDDQGRVRENLKILSKDSETYKRFLEKFEKQETRIEELQAQIRQVQTTIDRQRKEYEEFLNVLTAQ
jgi:hypothetical protein